MHDKLYVWLGSRRALKRNAGNKAALLDRAAHAGLPVPSGIVILDAAYAYALAEGWIAVEGDRVVPRDAAGLFLLVLECGFDRPVAVRSAFSAEDRPDASLAGYFTSVLRVDASDPDTFAAALCAVWSSALGQPEPLRRDVLVMEMVDARHAGVAFAEDAYQDDLVNYTTGTAEQLVGGGEAGRALKIPRRGPWERATVAEPDFAHRLQLLLRGVRRTLDRGDWDVEWADDGQVCWLIQARPVTRSPRRNEAFTFANFKEIMPDPPSPFMTDVVADIAPELYAYYRGFDPSLPDQRQMIEVYCGRPLFNISLLTDTMRHWGLPTRLVTDNIGGDADVAQGLQPARFLRKTPVLLRQGLDQLIAVRRARRTAAAFLDPAPPPPTFSAAADELRRLFARLVTQMFALTAAMSAPLLLLRRAGTLAEHNARHRSISTAMYSDLEPLRTLVAGRPDLHPALEAGHVPNDAAFLALWQSYLAKHGHRGVYETDIARPRFHEAPAPLLQSLTVPPVAAAPLPPLSLRGRLTAPLWAYLSRVLRAREQFRYDVMRAYDRLRRRFLTLAAEAVEAGRLPSAGDLWLLRLEEVRQLDAGWRATPALLAARRAELTALQQIDLPDMVHRFDDFGQYRRGAAPERLANSGRLRGVSLTVGTVEGQAWVLREPAGLLPAGYTPETTILVARSVDAGWIPTFSRVAGVVVETGGDLSHGSIILREIGLPAITNVAQATRHIANGDRLRLNAAAGTVERTAET
jgi:pyruvate,water dikinase